MQKEQESQLKKFNLTLPKFLIQMVQGGLVGLLLVLSLIGSKMLFDPNCFPVLGVKVVGELHYQDKAQLQTALLKELSKGFYGLSVNKLQKSLLSLSWVEASEVKRLWPDTIQVNLIERRPLVKWNKADLISAQGELFGAEKQELASLASLPRLSGPEGRHGLVWQNYLVMGKVLQLTDLKISELTLSPRGSWEMILENHTKVILGTREVLPRLRRFVRAYDKLMRHRQSEIAYLDLRYTSGMAVGWKNNVSWLGRG